MLSVISDEHRHPVPFSVWSYTIQVLDWAYHLCPMTCSLELLKGKEKTPFTPFSWNIGTQNEKADFGHFDLVRESLFLNYPNK